MNFIKYINGWIDSDINAMGNGNYLNYAKSDYSIH